MEKALLESIKRFISGMESDDSLSQLRKSGYVDGYRKALQDVKNLIDFAESVYPTEAAAV